MFTKVPEAKIVQYLRLLFRYRASNADIRSPILTRTIAPYYNRRCSNFFPSPSSALSSSSSFDPGRFHPYVYYATIHYADARRGGRRNRDVVCHQNSTRCINWHYFRPRDHQGTRRGFLRCDFVVITLPRVNPATRSTVDG